jgi:hypothetical protein
MMEPKSYKQGRNLSAASRGVAQSLSTEGIVQIWDVVGFDEVADLQKMLNEVITTMKTYCESGTFQRGQEAVLGNGSIAMFGNTNHPVGEIRCCEWHPLDAAQRVLAHSVGRTYLLRLEFS